MLLPVLAGVFGAGVLLVAYGVFVERRWYRLVRYRLDILPAGGSTALSVLHLSDLHFVRGDRRKASFLASLPKADVTVLTGDILGEAEAVETVRAALLPVRGRIASLFVLGSNDYFRPRPLNPLRYFKSLPRRVRKGLPGASRQLVAALEADGWAHLKNRGTDISLDGVRVEVGGLDDPHIHRHDIRTAIRREPDRFGLAVVHSPDPVAELAALGYDLIVAGHTHGGQVRLPVVGALITNSHMPRDLARGLSKVGDAYVHVSPGLGTSKYAPFRFLCRPEATILELSPSSP
ncbi:MAG: metallophosphoesterase [Actinomycetota bacterium]